MIKKNVFFLFFLFFFLTYIITIPLLILSLFSEKEMTSVSVNSIFNTIVITPVIETLIFQTLIFYICKKEIKIKNLLLIIFISALFFGLSHYYDLLYILYAFSVGIVFALSYAIFKKLHFYPTMSVILLHALRNSVAVLARYLEYNV